MRPIISRSDWSIWRKIKEEAWYMPLFLVGKAPSYEGEYYGEHGYDKPAPAVYAGDQILTISLWLLGMYFFWSVYETQMVAFIGQHGKSFFSFLAIAVITVVVPLIAVYWIAMGILFPFRWLNLRERKGEKLPETDYLLRILDKRSIL